MPLVYSPLHKSKTQEYAKIFYNNRTAYRAQELGADLALIGRLHDIGNKQAEKPYLFLVTLPTYPTSWQQQEAKILPFS